MAADRRSSRRNLGLRFGRSREDTCTRTMNAFLKPRTGSTEVTTGLIGLALTCVVGLTNSLAVDLVYAKDGSGVYGYRDTPKLPWCQWLVHDPDRPAAKRIDPGTAGPPAPVPSDAIVLFDGKDVSHWQPLKDWKVADGYLISGDTDLATK